MRVQVLQLGEECRAIEDRIRAAKFRDQIRFRSRWAARPDDLLQALNEDCPSVLHFSGHGDGDQGLCFQAEDGTALSVSTDGLAAVMRAAGRSVAVVLLNACYSEVQAQALVTQVPCVIGMSGAVGDEAAICYAASFYRALAFGKSVANAHEQGVAALALPSTSGQSRDIKIWEPAPCPSAPCSSVPRLLTRPDIDADRVYVVPGLNENEKTRCTIVIKATLAEFNADVLARVTEELRKLSGDLSLQIIDVAEGSVRLTVRLSVDATKKLAEMKAAGRLTQVGGFDVSEIFDLPEAASVRVPLTVEQYHRIAVGDRYRGVRRSQVTDERFTLEHLAGFGGMGQVYRARDRSTGELVALKVIHDAENLEIERFTREARILATVSHSGIVRYIDSWITSKGEHYLVMEWLSGETLSARLQRMQLTLSEGLALGRRVASVLGAIHRRGVVHRDIKPSNLFLRGSAIEKVTLIDFGMALRPLADPKLTVTGTMLGTPGYIAPEQACNMPNLDGRADIFSLGCVLYRCLSGRAPFRGPDALRMLLNGTPDQLPRLRELRPSIPRELDDLVARMLSRSPDDRPSNGDIVADELLAIEENEPSTVLSRSGPRSVISEIMASERRLMCVVARSPDKRSDGDLTVLARKEHERALLELAERHRGKLEVLPDGTLLVILSSADAATDLAVRAARCALALQHGGGPLVVVSGREVFGPGLPESELLDRAVALLEATGGRAAVYVDELMATLLKNRFEIGRGWRRLCGELCEADGSPLLPREPVPFVGREQEIEQLDTIFCQCTEERTASMVLLSGPAGVGKSRLGHEFLRGLESRGQPVRIWFGEADSMNVGSAFGLLVQVLRSALGFSDGDPIEVRRDKIRAWVARHPNARGARFAEILGEFAGTPFESEDDGEPVVELHDPQAIERSPGRSEPWSGDTLGNPRFPSNQMGQVFLSLLRAECAVQPVVIVLEDLQWGDLPTIKLIYAVLSALADQPLLVLAIARTEVHEIFPQLWADRCVQEIRLRKLSRRASAQLVRQVIGDAVGSEAMKSLVERSDRYAPYLEELIRTVEEGKATTTPQAVLAMVQARIEKLDPAARRVVRAASIFGETFWRGGVEALLGSGDTAAWLAVLVAQGMIEVQDNGRFPGEVEYRFQHALVREAAYEMLTKDDRVAGHWLAGQWLEQVGETDAMSIEEHFKRCGRS